MNFAFQCPVGVGSVPGGAARSHIPHGLKKPYKTEVISKFELKWYIKRKEKQESAVVPPNLEHLVHCTKDNRGFLLKNL